MMKKLLVIVLCLVFSGFANAMEIKTLPANIQASQSDFVVSIDHVKQIGNDILCIHIQAVNAGKVAVKSEPTDFMLNNQTPITTQALDNLYREEHSKVNPVNFIPYIGMLTSVADANNAQNEANQINTIEAAEYKGGIIFPGMKKEGYVFFKKTDLKDFTMFVMIDTKAAALSVAEMPVDDSSVKVETQTKKKYGYKKNPSDVNAFVDDASNSDVTVNASSSN